MHIEVRLPRVEPEVYGGPKECPKCGGQHFKTHGVQGEHKTLHDLGAEGPNEGDHRLAVHLGIELRESE